MLAEKVVTPGPVTSIPCPAALPGHAPAPHSLWELRIVEGGLKDASGEHWGHRRALLLVGHPALNPPQHHLAPADPPPQALPRSLAQGG